MVTGIPHGAENCVMLDPFSVIMVLFIVVVEVLYILLTSPFNRPGEESLSIDHTALPWSQEYHMDQNTV